VAPRSKDRPALLALPRVALDPTVLSSAVSFIVVVTIRRVSTGVRILRSRKREQLPAPRTAKVLPVEEAKELLDAGEQIPLGRNRVRPAATRSQGPKLTSKHRDVRVGDGAEIADTPSSEKAKQESGGLAHVLDRRDRPAPDRKVPRERVEHGLEAPRIERSLSAPAGPISAGRSLKFKVQNIEG